MYLSLKALSTPTYSIDIATVEKNNGEWEVQTVAHISERVEQRGAWILVNLGQRVDSFNFNEVKTYFDSLIYPGSLVAIDVRLTQFLSLAMFKYLTELSGALQHEHGALALLGVSQKLKHQMGLFGSLEKMLIVKRPEQLPQGESASVSLPPDETLGF